MNAWIGRVAGVIASAVVLWVLGVLGIEVTEEQKRGVIEWLTTGLTGLGFFLGLAFYGMFHKIFNRKLNPADTTNPGPKGGKLL